MKEIEAGEKVVFEGLFGGMHSGIISKVYKSICEVNEDGNLYLVAKESVIDGGIDDSNIRH